MLTAALRDLQWRKRRFVIAIVGTGLVFAMTLVQTDAHNRLRDQVERFKAGKVAPGVVEAHADL